MEGFADLEAFAFFCFHDLDCNSENTYRQWKSGK
jgi:hypothetical protein